MPVMPISTAPSRYQRSLHHCLGWRSSATDRQRAVGPEYSHAQEHDHRDAHVEREVLVRGAVPEVIWRE